MWMYADFSSLIIYHHFFVSTSGTTNPMDSSPPLLGESQGCLWMCMYAHLQTENAFGDGPRKKGTAKVNIGMEKS